MWRNGTSEALPHVYRHLLVLVKHCSPELKGTDHLLDHFIKEHTGQLRVQERFELKRHLRMTQEGANMLANHRTSVSWCKQTTASSLLWLLSHLTHVGPPDFTDKWSAFHVLLELNTFCWPWGNVKQHWVQSSVSSNTVRWPDSYFRPRISACHARLKLEHNKILLDFLRSIIHSQWYRKGDLELVTLSICSHKSRGGGWGAFLFLRFNVNTVILPLCILRYIYHTALFFLPYSFIIYTYIELHFAGGLWVFGSRCKPPYCF